MCDDFSGFILISIVNSLFEKLESIEYLKNKKFFNSARTLSQQPPFEMGVAD